MSALSLAAVLGYAATCAPTVPPITLLPIMWTESGFHASAVNVNRNGTVDSGLAQINQTNWSRLGLTQADTFDPCRSVAAAAAVLAENYHPASDAPEEEQRALRVSIAAYNAGPGRARPDSAYVRKVEAAAKYLLPALIQTEPKKPEVSEPAEKPAGVLDPEDKTLTTTYIME